MCRFMASYQTQGVHRLGFSIQELDVAIVRQFHLLAASKGNGIHIQSSISHSHCL